jgi:hypothetical protein
MLLEYEQRPWERTKDSETIRGARMTVGEDEGIGVGLVSTELDSCAPDYVLPRKDKLRELLNSRRTFEKIIAETQNRYF